MKHLESASICKERINRINMSMLLFPACFYWIVRNPELVLLDYRNIRDVMHAALARLDNPSHSWFW